ncbi:glycosyltransferase family 2 protein [Aliamphritea ceti]|uniref:glycosyltransferase family 2 protein n=1 Tax=Aliamphritea ceti TaxID=1524258 RepID=UPI0021C460A1|nr:glycosyltransferase family 2 protein [Aliamphritea ceti]
MATYLSAVIITLNEANNIADCISSLSFCDEIIVVDSGSTDTTTELAFKLGAKVINQSWLGYGQQKQFAVEQATNNWVLCLDADERISPELAKEIQDFMQEPNAAACQMPRCNRFMGRWLRHGEGYPDMSLRLFDRQQAFWSEDSVHEKVICNAPIKSLQNDILHYSQETLHQYIEKQNKYTSIQADILTKNNKNISSTKLIMSPLIRFIKFYLVRQGFRDGVPGLVHICIGCFNSFIKYAKVRALK